MLGFCVCLDSYLFGCAIFCGGLVLVLGSGRLGKRFTSCGLSVLLCLPFELFRAIFCFCLRMYKVSCTYPCRF